MIQVVSRMGLNQNIKNTAHNTAPTSTGAGKLMLVNAIAVRVRHVVNAPKAPSRWSVGFGPCRRAAPLWVGLGLVGFY
jgi:hypothetical protein